MTKIKGTYWVKWLDSKTYSECGFNKDGNLYVLVKIKVQRGMGNQLADELLITGMNKKYIQTFLQRNNAVIVFREQPPAEDQIKIIIQERTNL